MKKQHNFVIEGVSRLPPGFRFQPTDEELLFQYLRCKIFALPLPASVIPEVHFSKLDPWELPGDSKEERYVFTKEGAKYNNGNRNNKMTKATNLGYWEETGSEEHISPPPSQNLGMTMKGVKRTLIFNLGKSPNYTSPTDWYMHEYSLVYKNHKGSTSKMEDWVIYHVFLKQRVEENDDTIMLDYNGYNSITSNVAYPCSSTSSSSSNSFVDVSSYDSQSDEESSYYFM